MKPSSIVKSKTINFNVLAGAAYTLLTSLGVSVPEPVIVSILTIGNFILRFMTKTPISEK